MGKGAPGDPFTSPWTYQATDYQGNVIRIDVAFDDATQVLTGATVYRDAACVYRHIYLGVGADGVPDSTPTAFTVPAGTTTISAAALARQGLSNLSDVLALQVTAGP